MATWAMLKREKMNNQARQARFGSYGRFTENADRVVARDGKTFRVQPSDHLEPVARDRIVVKSIPAGNASGLSRSIGRVGKEGRVAWRGTHGNGQRREQGLTADMFYCETELIRGNA